MKVLGMVFALTACLFLVIYILTYLCDFNSCVWLSPVNDFVQQAFWAFLFLTVGVSLLIHLLQKFLYEKDLGLTKKRLIGGILTSLLILTIISGCLNNDGRGGGLPQYTNNKWTFRGTQIPIDKANSMFLRRIHFTLPILSLFSTILAVQLLTMGVGNQSEEKRRN